MEILPSGLGSTVQYMMEPGRRLCDQDSGKTLMLKIIILSTMQYHCSLVIPVTFSFKHLHLGSRMGKINQGTMIAVG